MKRKRFIGALGSRFLVLALVSVVAMGATSAQTAIGSVNQQTPPGNISVFKQMAKI